MLTIVTLMIVGILVMVLSTFLIDKYLNRKSKIKREYDISEETIEKYESEVYRLGGRVKIRDYQLQSRNFFGNKNVSKDGRIEFYKFHINLNNKNIQYIERNFTEIPLFKSINREKLINDLLKE